METIHTSVLESLLEAEPLGEGLLQGLTDLSSLKIIRHPGSETSLNLTT